MRIGLIHNISSTGSALYRLEIPHRHLSEKHQGVEFYSAANYLLPKTAFETLDLIIVSRMWARAIPEIEWLRTQCNEHGVKLVLDLDDYWVLESGHPFYGDYLENKTSDVIRKHIHIVDHVIVTNEFLASKVRPLNKNVTVIPNCTYEAYEQFKPQPIKSSLVRFGWFGGAQHYEDIILMQDGMGILRSDRSLDNRYLLYCAGWNDNPMYRAYEAIFTDGFKNLNYRRLLAADIYNYVSGYNNVDVCLAPLRDTTFNRCKSELKLVEAGTMGKAIIASDVYPYNEVIEHGVNGFLVREARSKDWHKFMKKLINEPELRESMAAKLSETIKERFNIDHWGKVRFDLYQKIVSAI